MDDCVHRRISTVIITPYGVFERVVLVCITHHVPLCMESPDNPCPRDHSNTCERFRKLVAAELN